MEGSPGKRTHSASVEISADGHLTTAGQLALASEFFSKCSRLMAQKAAQYNTSQDASRDVEDVCRVLGVEPIAVIWTHIRKHMSALEQFVRGRKKEQMESLVSRLMDIANYCAIGYAMEQWRDDLNLGWSGEVPSVPKNEADALYRSMAGPARDEEDYPTLEVEPDEV